LPSVEPITQPAIIPRTDLVGDRVRMRPNREEFAASLHAAAIESVETVGRWMPWCHADRKEEEGIDWLRKSRAGWDAGDEYEFTVFDHSGAYVGSAGLNQFNRVHNFSNLGYWIRQSRQGHGLAVEVVRLLAEFGFRVVGLTRIEIIVASENTRSRRVAEKAGALYEGLARNRLAIRGAPITAAVYALVPGADT
jgi:ribosomal-protein-serine acetyltransferase